MRVSEALPTGVTALLFDTARHRRQLEAQLVALLEAREHHEVVLPVIDYLDPYRALMNDARRGELYPLIDRDGEVLTLRADFTPMLARLIAPRLASLDLPLRLFYRGDVLRYQEERAGRQREFYQVGAELLGLDGADAEREALHTFADLLDAVRDGLDARIVIGAAGALDALLAGHGGDDPQALAAAVVRREQGVARDAAPALLEIVREGVPADPDDLGDAAASAALRRLQLLRDEVAAAHPQIDLRIDLAEFAEQVADPGLRARFGRGAATYDGIVFRAYAGAGGPSLGGGGRYDQLFRRLGADTTAAGFAFSVDRLMAAGEVAR